MCFLLAGIGSDQLQLLLRSLFLTIFSLRCPVRSLSRLSDSRCIMSLPRQHDDDFGNLENHTKLVCSYISKVID